MAVDITRPGGDIAGVDASGNVASYTSVNIGAAASDRIVVVCAGTELTGSVPTAATIDYGTGAQSMTAGESGTQGAQNVHIFYLAAPTGTSATVNVTFGSTNPTAAQNHIAVYRVVVANSTPFDIGHINDTDADPISSGALVINAGGGGIAICSNATAATARTWTGFTEDLDVDAGAFRFSTGTLTGAATPTITVSGGNNEDGALSWIIFNAPFTPTQTAFRVYADGTENGSTALAAQDTNADTNYTDIFHVRIRVQESGGSSGIATDDYRLTVSENSGSYVAISSATKVIQSAGGLVDGAATTNRLTGGTGSFVAGVQDENDTLIENYQLTASNFTELVWSLRAISSAVAHNDTLDFRVQYNTGGAGYTDFSSYGVTPRVTVKRAAHTQAAFRLYENGTESGSTAIAAQNTNITRDTTTSPKLHVRFRFQETNGFSDHPSGTPFKLMVSKNGAAYGTLDASDWSIDTASGLEDDNNTTERLTGGTGSFYAGLQEELSASGQTQNRALQASNYTEFVWAIQASGAGAFVNDNTYDFKAIIVSREHPTLGTNFDSYSQVPRITITGGSAPASLIGEPGSFTEAGQPVVFQTRAPGAAGSFTEAGQPILFQMSAPMGAGAYTLTGQDVTFRQAVVLAANTGTYTLSGQPAVFLTSVPVATGTFNETGQPVLLKTATSAAAGAYALSGQPALFRTSAPAAAGSFSEAGQPALFRTSAAVAAGTYTLSGQPALFRTVAPAATGVFILTGQNTAGDNNVQMAAGTGAFTLSGQAAQFIVNGVVASGAFSLAGQPALFRTVASVGTGAFTLTGQDVTFRSAIVMTAQTGAFNLTGVAALFDVLVSVGAGAFVLAGQNVTLGEEAPPAEQVLNPTGKTLTRRRYRKLKEEWEREARRIAQASKQPKEVRQAARVIVKAVEAIEADEVVQLTAAVDRLKQAANRAETMVNRLADARAAIRLVQIILDDDEEEAIALLVA